MNPALRRAARLLPPLRRMQDGMERMRTHIAALERQRDAMLDDAGVMRDQAAAMRARLAAAEPPSLRDGTAPEAVVTTMIDHAWCDTAGLFVNGWAHAGPHAVRRVVLLGDGGVRAETEAFTPRPDVGPHYAGLPGGAAAGFSLYLPGAAGRRLTLAVVSDGGVGEAAFVPPVRADEAMPHSDGAIEGFRAAMKARRGRVMELGARVVGSLTEQWRGRFEPECRYLANDIHPGPGIDVVADAHTLSAEVLPGSLDGVFSVAVLEHLAAPWRAAAEINRVLAPGGETLHVTHQTWPLHETPNDFFRMSDQALRSLFGPATGFEVVECGMAHPVSIVPPTHMRQSAWLWVPEGRGYGQSFIRARKVAECAPADAAWSAAAMLSVSRNYPQPE